MRYLLCGCLLLVMGCKKDEPAADLPAATQVGANTAGCLVNGQPLLAADQGGSLLSPATPGISGGFYNDSLYQLVLNGSLQGVRTTVTLFLRTHRVGSYPLNRDTDPRAAYPLDHATYSQRERSSEVYVTDAHHTGTVVLSCSNQATLVSAGSFEFTAASQTDPTRTVTVSSGRFDVKQ